MSRRFVPSTWEPSDKLMTWATETYRVTGGEVLRQVELMRDHEFRRPYSCWDRVFRNWCRKAEELNTWRRARTRVRQAPLTDNDRAEDQRKFEEQMRKYGVEVK